MVRLFGYFSGLKLLKKKFIQNFHQIKSWKCLQKLPDSPVAGPGWRRLPSLSADCRGHPASRGPTWAHRPPLLSMASCRIHVGGSKKYRCSSRPAWAGRSGSQAGALRSTVTSGWIRFRHRRPNSQARHSQQLIPVLNNDNNNSVSNVAFLSAQSKVSGRYRKSNVK